MIQHSTSWTTNMLRTYFHSGVVGAIWSAPHCGLYADGFARMMEGRPPPLRSLDHMNGWGPGITSQQRQQVQESQEIHRRSSILRTAVFQQGGFAGSEQPINSLAWQEPYHQRFLKQCSCYLVATPACKWGFDWFKTWAGAATSDNIQSLADQCFHEHHFNFRGKRLPDGIFISSLSAEYPSSLAAAIIEIIKPLVSQSSIFNQSFSNWRSHLARAPLSPGPRITDGAANWTVPKTEDAFKEVRKPWISRILQLNLHIKFTKACCVNQADPFIHDNDVLSFLKDLQDLQQCFPDHHFDSTFLAFQP